MKRNPFKPIPGECYRNAALWAQENPDWKVVHGIVFNPVLGHEMGHAWNEKDGWVYDPSVDMMIDRDKYYAIGRISYTHAYDAINASVIAVKERNWGPWDTKIWNAAHAQRKKKGKKNPDVVEHPTAKEMRERITMLEEAYELLTTTNRKLQERINELEQDPKKPDFLFYAEKLDEVIMEMDRYHNSLYYRKDVPTVDEIQKKIDTWSNVLGTIMNLMPE